MAKWQDGDESSSGGRGGRGHRNRDRARKDSWEDAPAPAAPLPAYRSAPPPRAAVVPGPMSSEVEDGVVKLFDTAKGFGFVTTDKGFDLFVHISTAMRAGLTTLVAGQAIRFHRGPGRVPGKDAVAEILPD